MGTIEPRKNVPTLLRAYAELLAREPDAPPLVLAGRAYDRVCVGPRRPLASRLSRAAPATWGTSSGAEREQSLSRRVDGRVAVASTKGFGLPALEAMTIGVPVVVSSRGALPEVVGDAGLVVDPDDVAGMAAAMQRILNDPASRAAARKPASFKPVGSAGTPALRA